MIFENVWTVPPKCLSSKQSNFSNLFISDGKFVNVKGKRHTYKLQRLDLRLGPMMMMMAMMYQIILCPWPESMSQLGKAIIKVIKENVISSNKMSFVIYVITYIANIKLQIFKFPL